MSKARLAEILKKRGGQHIRWIFIGCALSPEEARELERLGYGELRGGDNGVFWLYPVGGNDEQDEQPPRDTGEKKPRGRKRDQSAPTEDAQQQTLKEW